MSAAGAFALNAACFLAALAIMEGVAWLSHKYIMHGFLWRLHASHHGPRAGAFEKNDWFAIFFASPSVLLIYLGQGHSPTLWAGLGVAAYGLIYFLFHDIIVHRRIDIGYRPKRPYLRRIVHAHRLHHTVREKQGAVSFGFLYAPPIPVLRARMKAQQAQLASGHSP